MDLIRILKLKKLNNEFENIPEPYLYFINLISKLDTTKKNNILSLHSEIEDGDIMTRYTYLLYDYNHHILYCSKTIFDNYFIEKYGYTIKDINRMINKIFLPYFTKNKVIIRRTY